MATKQRKRQTIEGMSLEEVGKYLSKEVRGVDIEIASKRHEEEGDVEPLPTGFPALDLKLGIGGFPKGKIIEVSGEEGVSKSALTQTVAGVLQWGGIIRPFRKNYNIDEIEGYNCVWIDAEKAVDMRIPKQRKHFKERLGLDPDKILISQPDTAEQAFNIIRACAVSGSVDYVVLDSVVALATEEEYKKDMDEGSWNKLPQVINRGLRNIAPVAYKNDCTIIVLNQLRANTEKKNKFDDDWKTTGGKGLKHWCSLRIQLNKGAKIKDEATKVELGHIVRAKIIKTRLDVLHGDAKLYFYRGEGFNYGEELFELASEYEVIYAEKQGRYTWYDHEEEFGRKSRNDFIELLNEDEELYTKIYEDVKYYFENAEDEVDEDLEDQESEEYEEEDDEDEE